MLTAPRLHFFPGTARRSQILPGTLKKDGVYEGPALADKGELAKLLGVAPQISPISSSQL
jgi:hypothetical protein